VFLRILEYYSGILFLTTNRVGAIDDAFRSRLHLTLYYPKLTKKQTKEIFKRNFLRIEEINNYRDKNGLPLFEYRDSEPKIMAWAKESSKTLKWNGRQIRNTFQTVLALAEFHSKAQSGKSANPVVTKKYFRIVANAALQFDEYLLATHGADEDKVANRDYIRASGYKPLPMFESLDQSDTDSSSEEESIDDTETSSDSDRSDDSDREKKQKKKKKSNAKKAKELKESNRKKSKKTSEKERSEKKGKPKKKKGKNEKKEEEEKENCDDETD
jgi:hypothetical protein